MAPVGLSRLPKVVQRILLVLALALALGMVLCAHGIAAPRVSNVEDCQTLSYTGLIARSLAVRGVERARADAIVSDLVVPHVEEAVKLIRLVTDAAYRSELAPLAFGRKLFGVCVAGRGNLDELLGIDL